MNETLIILRALREGITGKCHVNVNLSIQNVFNIQVTWDDYYATGCPINHEDDIAALVVWFNRKRAIYLENKSNA